MSKKLKKCWKCYHNWKMWGLIQIKTSIKKYNKEIKITNKKEIIIRYTIFPSYKNFWLTSNNI